LKPAGKLNLTCEMQPAIFKLTTKSFIIAVIVFLLIIISGVIYIRHTWITSKNKTSEQALKTAQTAAIAFRNRSV
jgi:hypothetical protein